MIRAIYKLLAFRNDINAVGGEGDAGSAARLAGRPSSLTQEAVGVARGAG